MNTRTVQTFPATVANTFRSFPDGSGALAHVELRCGLVVYLSRASKVETTWHLPEKKNGVRGFGGPDGFGYGKAAGMARSELKKAIADFDAKVAALGPEWLAANAAMYAEDRA